MEKKFDVVLQQFGIILSEEQKVMFERYYNILTEWNKVMNLTAITEREEVDLKHFADSLSVIRVCDLKDVSSVIDVGTGAGFPGIPLKIAFPHLRVVLLDSLNKRVNFLNEVIKELNLKDIHTVHGRAEDYSHKQEYREQFDLCVSRAVANLSTLSEYCLPFVKKEGYFISYKSSNSQEEIEKAGKAVDILGGMIENVDNFVLPGSDMGRSLVKIRKVKNTPKKYPRKAGIPSREPLQSIK